MSFYIHLVAGPSGVSGQVRGDQLFDYRYSMENEHHGTRCHSKKILKESCFISI